MNGRSLVNVLVVAHCDQSAFDVSVDLRAVTGSLKVFTSYH